MHDFTTFERTAPVGDDNDPIRKHMKKFRCQACKKDKFHIPLKTVDGRTVCIHCCLSESGQNIVLDKRTVDALEAVADRIKGYDNYPPKETTEPTTTNKGTKMKLKNKVSLIGKLSTLATLQFTWPAFVNEYFRAEFQKDGNFTDKDKNDLNKIILASLLLNIAVLGLAIVQAYDIVEYAVNQASFLLPF